ncbi:facilitated trehalose transporter Tret1-like [Achroia grisella]|uniref:facilitated trehalose transporter Tret1-like n=1 Tax=Achroia grisella TaxID=688607 RepID=UPI0027D2A645|nr:facilitated trehalose transporter Tret1-like [Achroia grisella]
MYDKYFLRQCFIASGIIFQAFCGSMSVTLPSVLNPILLSPNTSDIKATSYEVSWLAACNSITGLVGYFVLSPMMQKIGRKMTHFSVSVTVAIGLIVLALAKNMVMLFIARLIHGLYLGSIFINSIIACEYSDPKRRSYMVAIKKLSVSFGVLASHTLALCWTWRQISIFSIFPAIIAMIINWYWPESPSYLALKGKIDECRHSFYWLHGKSGEKEYELRILIAAQTETRLKNKLNKSNMVIQLLHLCRDKAFLKPFFVTTVLLLAVDASGRFYFVIYVTQIIKEIVGNESSAAYCTIFFDIITIVAIFASLFVIHKFKRRTVICCSGFMSGLLMIIISILIYLKSQFVTLLYLSWIALSVIMIQNFITCIGLIPISYNIIGEIFPLEYKGSGPSFSGISFMTFYFISLKFTPVIIEEIGLQGMYFMYGLSLLLCIFVLYYILPETKDKTLQDIEDEIRGIKRTTVEASKC